MSTSQKEEIVYLIKKDTLQNIANAIKEKESTIEEIEVSQFANRILNLKNNEDEIINRSISGTYKNESITSIGPFAFSHCYHLTEIDLPNVVNVEQEAFSNCSDLTKIKLDSCKNINYKSFYSCTSLNSIAIPSCLEIKEQAFANCSNLKTLYLLGDDLCVLTGEVFENTPIGNLEEDAIIYVKQDMLENYQKETSWSKYFDIIKIYNE